MSDGLILVNYHDFSPNFNRQSKNFETYNKLPTAFHGSFVKIYGVL